VYLSTKLVGERTVLDGLRQSGSSKCLFPRHSGKHLEAVVLNTAGGVTGGDSFAVMAHASAGTTLTTTTQACERAYKAQSGQVGQIRNHLTIASRARINWLAQETILFDGCALDRKLSIDMESGASLLMVEPLIFGRRAMGEALTDVCFLDKIEIRKAGKTLFLDTVRLIGNAQAHLAKRYIANGAGALATVIYVADDAALGEKDLRSTLAETAGISLIQDDVLVLRLLAKDGYDLRQTMIPVLKRLYGDDLPRCWMT
jgi:urease accessory protein